MPAVKPEGVITTMLVDDHLLVRRGFRRMLEDDPAIAVVAEAGDGQEAVDLAVRLRPNVVVMDYALPSMNGATAARKIRAAVPEAAILILSMHSEAACVRNCMEAGVRGYLLKNAMDLELVDAVKILSAGGTLIDPRLEFAAGKPGDPASALSGRELEVLQLIVNGKSNKDIGVILNISANTVNVHRANIMQTLDIHNTAELVVYAIRNGLVTIA
ncbi:MAG: response regulator transcription factor [Acidobacteriota bacterium]|nr:response regulator transcription factor [Acidobacteriota bacterium]